MQAYSQCTDNGDGTFTTRDGAIWQSCALGSTWQNDYCGGESKSVNWKEAITAAKNDRFLGHNDWIVPSIELYRNNFFDGKCSAKSNIRVLPKIYRDSNFNGVEGHFWTSNIGESSDSASIVAASQRGYHDISIYKNSVQPLGNVPANSINVVFVRNTSGSALEKFNLAEKQVSADSQKRKLEDAKRREYENSPAYKAEVKRREAQERRESADREASTRQACSRLYIGKPVSWPEGRTCVLTGCDNFTLHGQIVGVGNGVASAKVTESYKYGQVHEKACNEF